MNRFYINPEREEWPALVQRPVFDYASLEQMVAPILENVKINGDAAVKKYAAKFDKARLDNLRVSSQEMQEAVSFVSADLKAAIDVARQNIYAVHAAQQEPVKKIITSPGVECWRKSTAIEKVGLYIPGGSAPLFSTLLMLAIPAQIAGCRQLVVCTPGNEEGKVSPVILYVAQLLGIETVFKIGGVQAIAAMAYGTETIPKVYKIFGPGNQYVTAAKQLVNSQGIAIDMPAGPSEVALYADETSLPAFVAADLLSQAEHGPDSQVILVASNENILEQVSAELQTQLTRLPRRDIAKQALQHSRWIVMKNIKQAFDLLNEYAAEHLIIASDNAVSLCEMVTNAGSVFLGNYSPESAGDYASGTNHTLPTNGYAKAYSGVSVDSFVKKITFQQVSREGIRQIGPAVEAMAEAEGLHAHKNAVTIRTNTV
ncbi:MAG: histidinol dehydrogenase [Chitinophagaceae bacterium]|nr:MAG: histidinol dehydrogenase [Chitinophagaceae bacterium]